MDLVIKSTKKRGRRLIKEEKRRKQEVCEHELLGEFVQLRSVLTALSLYLTAKKVSDN
jgi:hypothetical protein